MAENVKLDGASERTFCPAAVPVRATDTGVVESLVRVRNPVNVPSAEDEKVTIMLQLAPLASEEPQVLVWLKPVPEVAKLLSATAVLPVFVKVAVWEAVPAEEAVVTVAKVIVAGASDRVLMIVGGFTPGLLLHPASTRTQHSSAKRRE